MAAEWRPVDLTGDPALAKCNRCGRSTWSPSEVGAEDRMPQPDNNPCGGTFVPASSGAVSE